MFYHSEHSCTLLKRGQAPLFMAHFDIVLPGVIFSKVYWRCESTVYDTMGLQTLKRLQGKTNPIPSNRRMWEKKKIKFHRNHKNRTNTHSLFHVKCKMSLQAWAKTICTTVPACVHFYNFLQSHKKEKQNGLPKCLSSDLYDTIELM